MTVTNSTIDNNSAFSHRRRSLRSPALGFGPTLTLSDCTISNNSAVRRRRHFRAYRLADAVATTSWPATREVVGPARLRDFAVANYDLIGVNSGFSLTSGQQPTRCQRGIAYAGQQRRADRRPALLPTSPAIGAGEIVIVNGSSVTTDQRGFSRPTSSPAPTSAPFELETVTSSTAELAPNRQHIGDHGSAFDTTAANDTVTFTNSGLTGTVTGATSTSLTVSLSGLSSVTRGTPLYRQRYGGRRDSAQPPCRWPRSPAAPSDPQRRRFAGLNSSPDADDHRLGLRHYRGSTTPSPSATA